MGNVFSPERKETSITISNNCEKCRKIPAYIISMTDELYNSAKDRLKKFGLENINKFDAVRGDSLDEFIKNPRNVSERTV